MKKHHFILLGIIVLAAFLRLYKVNTPLADWHSWRQSDTASVSKEYVKNGVDLLHPKYQDISTIPSGKANPEGYRMVEFPVVNGLIAFVYRFFNLSDVVEVHVFSRLFSIIFSLGSLVYLYKVVHLFNGRKLALLAAFVFAVMPYNIFYSRTILPEIPLVFFSLMGLFYWIKYIDQNSYKDMFWGSLACAIAILLKPTAVFMLLPIDILAKHKRGWKWLFQVKHLLAAFLIVVPIIVWRIWIQQFPEGIPASLWLLNGDNIRLKGAFFRWIFAERVGKMMLGYWGLIFFGLGFLSDTGQEKKQSILALIKSWFVAHKKQSLLNKHDGFILYFSWLLSMFAYLVIFATGNVKHDYYQIMLVPVISVFVARGILFLLEAPKKYSLSKIPTYSLLGVCLLFSLAFSWFEIRGLYQINNPAIVEAGKAVDQLVESDALVIAPYGGDTAFLYQTNRKGWPIGGAIEDKIKQGADYYVTTVMDDEAKELLQSFELVTQKDSYTLIKLN